MAETASVQRLRIGSIDVVRGVIMVLMALDHTRDFFGNSGVSPTDLTQTTIPLFFTRWITYFCAPVFFLLTGTGAYLSLRKKSRSELSGFLFTRGLWLIFLEVVVTRGLGLQFNFDYRLTVLIVLWALGWAMIALSVLVYLPTSLVAAFGIVMIAAHNLLDSVSSNPVWSILHSPNFVVTNPEHQVFCHIPSHSMDWSDRSRLWPGTDLQLAFGTPSGVSVVPRCRFNCGFLCLAGHQRLLRSAAVGGTEIDGFHWTLISEHDKVSAIAAVPVDDAWARPALLGGGGRRDTATAAASSKHREGADVLLRSASSRDSSARNRGLLCAIRASALDVRIAES
jgi:Heparan-alpha-glucosaminide N-acetyltransferase, catalytic